MDIAGDAYGGPFVPLEDKIAARVREAGRINQGELLREWIPYHGEAYSAASKAVAQGKIAVEWDARGVPFYVAGSGF